MRSRYITIPANSETQIRGNTKRIVVLNAERPFRVVTDREEEATLRRGYNFRFEAVAGFVRLINDHGTENRLELIIASSDEGDLTAASDTTEVANISEFTRAGREAVITNMTVADTAVQILTANSERRVAVIQTSAPVNISTEIGGAVFTVDGSLTHDCAGDLYAIATDSAEVQVIEYLN